MKTTDPIKLLQEIEAWFCFNYNPDKNSIYKLRQDIKYCLSNIDQQHPSREKIIEVQSELIEHLQNYHDSTKTEIVKIVNPTWELYLEDLYSQLSDLSEGEEEPKPTDEVTMHDLKDIDSQLEDRVNATGNDFLIEQLKKDFSGSSDYLSGVNDGMYHHLRSLQHMEELGAKVFDKLGIEQSQPEQKPTDECADWIHEERVEHNDDNYCPICGKKLKQSNTFTSSKIYTLH